MLWLFIFASVSATKLESLERDILKETCGRGINKIVNATNFVIMNGRQVELNEFPFAVQVKDKYGADEYSHCSGVLITSRHILTAAHCVYYYISDEERERICKEEHNDITGHHRVIKGLYNPLNVLLYVGSSCPRLGSCAPQRPKYRAVSITPHDEFNICSLVHDLAIVELDGNVGEKEAVPICLPKGNEELPHPLMAIGYGYDPDAKNDPGLQVATFEGYEETEFHIIAKDETSDVCSGDSGGPLFGLKEQRHVLYGLTSFGRSCSEGKDNGKDEKIPKYVKEEKTAKSIRKGHYADVRLDIQWICRTTGACQEEESP